jgi:hypothetical protein
VQSLVYPYDAVGNVMQIDDYSYGPPQYQAFQYDELDRLTRAEVYNGVAGNFGPQVDA